MSRIGPENLKKILSTFYKLLLKNVKCKVMFTEVYLEPIKTFMMELIAIKYFAKMLPH